MCPHGLSRSLYLFILSDTDTSAWIGSQFWSSPLIYLYYSGCNVLAEFPFRDKHTYRLYQYKNTLWNIYTEHVLWFKQMVLFVISYSIFEWYLMMYLWDVFAGVKLQYNQCTFPQKYKYISLSVQKNQGHRPAEGRNLAKFKGQIFELKMCSSLFLVIYCILHVFIPLQ